VYAKVYSQIFDSSLAEDYATRHVFMDLLVLADPTGLVDMTAEAIARRTNGPLEVVVAALKKLEQPDKRSRSKNQGGRRIVRLDKNRDWGWQIVNFAAYRNMKDEDEKREYMRDYMRKRRLLNPVKLVKRGKSQLAEVTHAEEQEQEQEQAEADRQAQEEGEAEAKDVAVGGARGSGEAVVPVVAPCIERIMDALRDPRFGEATRASAACLLQAALGYSNVLALDMTKKYDASRIRAVLQMAVDHKARRPGGWVRKALNEGWTT